MDSLTQIVLGAAVGEVVLGKKIGNRAMIWGAVAGTIPDFDVIVGSVFMNDINGLAFHRAITHSIFFAVVFSFLLAFYTNWIYSNGHHKNKAYKLGAIIGSSFFMIVIGGLVTLIANTALKGNIFVTGLVGLLSLGSIVYIIWRSYHKYFIVEQEIIQIGWKQWYKLFFWAIFTHPLLDCMTVYGTQLFAPFTNYRVALNSISVADPVYTVPFAICLIFAAFQARSYFDNRRNSNNVIDNSTSIPSKEYKTRMWINWAGIIISSLYLSWTVSNKWKVNGILENTLAEKNIDYSRYMTGPSILNNVLWSATAETDSSFYTGLYSFYDKEKSFKLFEIPKRHYFLDVKPDDKVINTLRWFSKDYYGVMRRKDGRLQINDLRYGTFNGKPADENGYIFKFVVERNKDGYYELDGSAGGPPRGRESEVFDNLKKRIFGI